MRLTQLKALSMEEWQVLLFSLLLLPLIALSLRLKGFKWTRGFLQKQIPESKNALLGTKTSGVEYRSTLQTAQSLARMVSVAANYGPYRANCLKRSLTTWWILQRKGIAAELNIGVNKDAPGFNAHAWVEYMGNTLSDADDISKRYSIFSPQ